MYVMLCVGSVLALILNQKPICTDMLYLFYVYDEEERSSQNSFKIWAFLFKRILHIEST